MGDERCWVMRWVTSACGWRDGCWIAGMPSPSSRGGKRSASSASDDDVAEPVLVPDGTATSSWRAARAIHAAPPLDAAPPSHPWQGLRCAAVIEEGVNQGAVSCGCDQALAGSSLWPPPTSPSKRSSRCSGCPRPARTQSGQRTPARQDRAGDRRGLPLARTAILTPSHSHC